MKKKSSRSTKRAGAMPAMTEDESHSIDVRKIQNGFVVRQSHSGPKGYKSSETYHPTKPAVGVPLPAPKLPAAKTKAAVMTPSKRGAAAMKAGRCK